MRDIKFARVTRTGMFLLAFFVVHLVPLSAQVSNCQLVAGLKYSLDSAYSTFDDDIESFDTSSNAIDIIVFKYPRVFGKKNLTRIYGNDSSLVIKTIVENEITTWHLPETESIRLREELITIDKGIFVQACDEIYQIHSNPMINCAQIKVNGTLLFYYYSFQTDYSVLGQKEREMIARSIHFIEYVRSIGSVKNR
jgi:hypothetical protein